MATPGTMPRRWRTRRALALALALAMGLPALVTALETFTELDEQQLRASVDSYLGTRYRYGGATRSGMDCSGFVAVVYREQGIELPRQTGEQYHVGEPLGRGDLRVGDLIFFRTRGRGVSHVGIYVGDGSFAHASTSRGVVVESMSDAYWDTRYVGARRIASPSTIVVSGEEVGRPATRRVALMDMYPYVASDLIDVPTSEVDSTAGLRFRLNSSGDLTINPQMTFWRRLQLGGFLRVESLVVEGSPKLTMPDLLAKVHVNDEGRWLPSFAAGIDTREQRTVYGTPSGDSVATSDPRGAFIAATSTLGPPTPATTLFGAAHFHAGASFYPGGPLRHELSFFIGLDQPFLERATFIGEIDNIFGRSGWRANIGARLAITSGASIEYAYLFTSQRGAKDDRVLRFSFSFPH